MAWGWKTKNQSRLEKWRDHNAKKVKERIKSRRSQRQGMISKILIDPTIPGTNATIMARFHKCIRKVLEPCYKRVKPCSALHQAGRAIPDSPHIQNGARGAESPPAVQDVPKALPTENPNPQTRSPASVQPPARNPWTQSPASVQTLAFVPQRAPRIDADITLGWGDQTSAMELVSSMNAGLSTPT